MDIISLLVVILLPYDLIKEFYLSLLIPRAAFVTESLFNLVATLILQNFTSNSSTQSLKKGPTVYHSLYQPRADPVEQEAQRDHGGGDRGTSGGGLYRVQGSKGLRSESEIFVQE